MSPALLAAFALLSLPLPAVSLTSQPATTAAPLATTTAAAPSVAPDVAPADFTTPNPTPSTAFPVPPPLALQLPATPAFSSGGPSPFGLAGGVLVILCLGVATLWLQRRKRQGPRHIQVVETASLGPKRSLALVVVGRQSMLLSCCDSGIFLVSCQPATAEMLQGADQIAAGVGTAEPAIPLFRRVPQAPAAGPEGFAGQLAEAEETQGLRRRLSEAGVLR